jgi:hypothetical protein
VDMNQIPARTGAFSVQLQLGGHATGSEGQVFILPVGCACGGQCLRLDSEPTPVLVQIRRKPNGLIDLLDFFSRESRDSLLDQNFGKSRDIVEINDARNGHALFSI